MAKKRIKRNKRYFNTYDGGGLLGDFASWNKGVTEKFMNSGVGGALGKLGVTSGGLGGIANGAANMISGLMNPNGNSTGVGNALSAIGSAASNIPGIGGVIGAGVNLVGGLVNTMFGSNINEEFVNQTRDKTNEQRGFTSNARDNSSLLSDWASYADMSHVNQDDVGSEGWFSDKAKDLTKELNREIDKANLIATQNLGRAAQNVDNTLDNNIMANFSAYGGPITMRYTGPMSPFGNTFADGGGIHIKPKNRGKFTALKKRTGKSATWFKEHGTPAQRKMATFALNARKWKHEDGGPLFTHGGIWSNGITTIDNGGTHEENPFEGVQMGVDPQGIPNLVEEGEVVFNDYVFSNRMKVPKDIKKRLKIKGDTYADAAKELSKESEERPNDPISKNGLDFFMSALSESQEELRMKNENRRANRYAKGGKLGKLFEGLGPDSNWIDYGTLASPVASDQLERMMELGIDGSAIPLTGTSEEIEDAITRAAAKKGTTTEDKSNEDKPNLSYLRYAPAIMSGISAFSDIFSKPDYSAADRVASIDIQPALVSADPIGQYLSYKPLDRMFYINQLNKNAAATRRAVNNNSGGNRAAALAGILAADASYGENLGKLARQAEEYNQALKERVTGFNRQTDMFNSEQSMQAQAANQASRNSATQMRLAQAERVAQLRQAARDAYNARRSNNLNSFITNLGNIGWEEKQAEWLDNLAKRGVLLMNTSGEYTGVTKKNGGKLKKKRRTIYA